MYEFELYQLRYSADAGDDYSHPVSSVNEQEDEFVDTSLESLARQLQVIWPLHSRYHVVHVTSPIRSFLEGWADVAFPEPHNDLLLKSWRVRASVIKSLGFQVTGSEPQGGLALENSFAPSKALVQFWLTGTAAFLAEGGQLEEAAKLRRSRIGPDLLHEFAVMVTGTLAQFAQEARYQSNVSPEITRGGRFRPSLQTLFCDKFFILPDEGESFLRLLESELRSALKSGCHISGVWGTVRLLQSADITFDLVPGKRENDPNFIRGRVVE